MRTPARLLTFICIWVVTFLSAGCSMGGSDMSDLQKFVADQQSKPRGSIEPLPPLVTYDAYIYNVTALRSPFEPPIEIKELVKSGDPKIKPDWTREREFLETFGIESLSMLGTLKKDGVFWALIKDGLGGINRVTVGNYLGKDHGQIVAASATEVNLVEIVSDGLGGWLQRPRTLKLVEKD
jgi:type IV pilus assembly protein PilP